MEWFAGAPPFVSGLLIGGMYRVLSWVVSVMLPPMAIFFPLFTLLEDLGYLPRIAFNMDKFFKKAHAHGKQALTMYGVRLQRAVSLDAGLLTRPRAADRNFNE